LKNYRGSKENLRRKTAQQNATGHRIARHVNTLVANNPAEIQQYIFAMIAHDLGIATDEVRSAISDGGYNGITICVTEDARREMNRFKS
jgi:hypothetical protein